MIYVLAALKKGDEVLLIRRYNAAFGDGLYSLVGGKLETGETALQAIKREVAEEVALDIAESAFTLVHTLHRKGMQEFIALCFVADISTLNPKNNEPDKHDDMRFFPMDALPVNMVPAHEQILQAIASGKNYSEHGWSA